MTQPLEIFLVILHKMKIKTKSGSLESGVRFYVGGKIKGKESLSIANK